MMEQKGKEVITSKSNDSKAVVLSDRSLRTKKEERVVLKEDEYLKKLGKIIQRDFFPDLPKMKAQNEYLEAVERNDAAKIRALQMRYSTQRRTDLIASPTRRSPKSFDAPTTESVADKNDDPAERPGTSADGPSDLNDADDTEVAKKKVKTTGVGVDAFLSKYTSEDNASFEELAALEERRERIRHGWMYRAEKEHMESRVTQEPLSLKAADEQLALPSTERPKALDNWPYKARNSVLFHPADAEFTDDELFKRKKMAERQIRHENTRVPSDVFQQDIKSKNTLLNASILQAAKNRGKVDVSGVEQQVSFAQGAVTGFGGQKYSFVATPSPAPGVNESPLMTWGEIEGTPFRLDAGDVTVSSTQPVFKIPEVPVRDKLALEMSDEIAKRYNEKRKRAVESAKAAHSSTPRFGSTRSHTQQFLSMSPAARRLASSKLGIRLGTDKALKQSYTPSPRRTPGTVGAKTPSTMKTPTSAHRTRSMGTSRTSTAINKTPSTSLTDNLLNLNTSKKRPGAEEFF